jgi:hypothetical protein
VVEISRQARVSSPWLPAVVPPDSAVELHRRRGHLHAGGLGVLGMAQVGSRWCGGLDCGLDTGAAAPEGTCLRWSGPMAALAHIGEQLREQQGRERKNRGAGRRVTLRDDSRALERRQEHNGDSGRRWGRHGCTTRVR